MRLAGEEMTPAIAPRYQKSAVLHERAKRVLAGGVSTMVRANFEPVPLYIDRGQGPRVWDVDGNEYLDYALAFGPLILGHSHPAVVEALVKQASRGQTYGAQHEMEPQLAEAICRAVPGAQAMAMAMTGSEAVQLALRLARAATGRSKVVKFEGHYHGWIDSVLHSFGPPIDALGPLDHPNIVAGSGGMAPGSSSDLIVLPWNSLHAVEDALSVHGNQVAALIMEPVMFNSGGVIPSMGYLQGVRDLCDRYGVVLIFDEVITGFRLAHGGAQSWFGVQADLAVFGKAVAGGLPLSCVVGRDAIIREIDHGNVVQAGTLNGNPISVAVALAVQRVLAAEASTLYPRLHSLGGRLREGLLTVLRGAGYTVAASGIGPAFTMSFGLAEAPRDYRDYAAADRAGSVRFAHLLLDHGILSIQRGMWYVSTAHTEQDVDTTIEVAREALANRGSGRAE